MLQAGMKVYDMFCSALGVLPYPRDYQFIGLFIEIAIDSIQRYLIVFFALIASVSRRQAS